MFYNESLSMKKFYLWLMFQLLFCGLYAQTVTVTGVVSTSYDDTPLPGVSIQIKGTTEGTITDERGNFKINTKKQTVLVFSYVGYVQKEIIVDNTIELNIILEEDIIVCFEEVVVTALGIQRETRDLGYNVQSIDSKEISTVKDPNFVNNLAGKFAGVTVSQGATGVGSTSKITIRGEASFTNNNPLFVVDGTPINNNSIVNFTNDAAAGFQEVDFGNGGMEINADDIESVSVLKGPSAAALYGTRASNGVIQITTKEGRRYKSKGLGIHLSSSVFVDNAFRLPQFQNQYGQGNSGQFEFVNGLGAGTNDNITYSWGPRLNEGTLIPQFDSPVTLPNGTTVRGGDVAVHGGAPITPTPFNAFPNNLKDFYQTGVTRTNHLAIESGNEKASQRFSFTDLRSESIIPGVNLLRKTLSSKLIFQPIDQLKVNVSANYINSNSDNRPSNGYGSENVNYSLVAWGPRSLDINALQDYWQPGLEGTQQYSYNYTFFDNPYFILKENRNSFSRNRLFGNVSATYFLNDYLSVALRSGLDYSQEERQFRRAFSTNRFRNGAYAVHDVFYQENNTDILLTYARTLDDFDVTASFGANRFDQKAATVQTQTLALAQPGVFNLANAATPLEIVEFENRKRINSLYGLFKIGYKNILFLEATARNDWSSALATATSTDNTSFFYPSVSTAFVLSEAVELPYGIDFVKLRGSWAQVGNDTDPYQTQRVFNAQTPYNGQPTFAIQTTLPNSNLLPEQTTSVEFGGEFQLFNGRVDLDVTYYNALTENQIISLPVSISSGFNQQVVNGGKVRSKGIELIAGTYARIHDFTWRTTLNFSRNVTRVKSLPEGIERLTLAYSRVYDNVNQSVFYQVEEGGQIGDMYGTGYLKNENGDFVIGKNGLFTPDNELKKLGNYNPDFMLGIANSFSYKNWQLNFLFDWRQGGQLVSRTLALAAVGGQLEETANRPEEGIVAQGVVNVGTVDEPIYQPNTKTVSAEAYYRNFYDRNHEENNTYNASYLKLREFSISYQFPDGFLKSRIDMSVSLIGRNLFAISEIPHFDPEQLAVQGQRFISGVEDMSYATSRSFGLKVDLRF